MAQPVIQTSFAAGEISPSLYGQVDLTKYHAGAALLRNFFVDYRGGAVSRPGTQFIGQGYKSATPIRLIPFQFSTIQTYVLEFGDLYMRVIKNGGYVLETAKNITAATKANPGVITSNAHGFSNGDWIEIASVVGMTQLNGNTYIVAGVTANTFTLKDLFGNVIDTTAFTTYSSGGTASRIYTLTTTYAGTDLALLKFAQDKDTMTFTHTSYVVKQLTRSADNAWTLTSVTFASTMTPPTGLVGTKVGSGATTFSTTYVVTTLDNNLYEESIPSAQVTIANGALNQTTGVANQLDWTPVASAGGYAVYKTQTWLTAGGTAGTQFGYVGTTINASFTDLNIGADFSQGPPIHNNPFAAKPIIDVNVTNGGAGYTQATIGYSITTSTGSGFSGIPLVNSGGAFGGFIIYNGGSGYANTDTITITGGGAAGIATGTYTFNSGIPSNNQTIILNGTTWTFKTSGATGNQTNIGGTLAATLNQLVSDLNASGDTGINQATYTNSTTVLTVTYVTPGTGGNAYTLAAGTYGGTVSGAHLTGGTNVGAATATLTIGPATGVNPGTVTFFQQRRTFGGTLNNPDTLYATASALYNNMDVHDPVRDDDALELQLASQQANIIKSMVPMASGLIVLTSNGAWQMLGSGASALNPVAITPSDAVAEPQAYNGCNDMPPIVINYDILFVQSKNGVVRDLSYNFYVNVYTGTDMTVLANHLFFGYQLQEWAWAEEPYKTVWIVRNDGVLLSFAYLKEQNVYAWAHHDTNGLYKSVCSIPETVAGGPLDSVYVVVQRYVNSQWVQYIERFDHRILNGNIENAWCVDAGLQVTMPTPAANLTVSGISGSITVTADAAVFAAGDVAAKKVIRLGGGKGTVTAFTSTTVITVTLTNPITAVLPNDPANTVVPILSGQWTYTTPITVVNGLPHLVGKTVSILGDGNVMNQRVVAAPGTITLEKACSQIVVGLPYQCQLQTLYLDTGEPTTQGKRKKITALTARCQDTRGIKMGRTFAKVVPYKDRKTTVPLGQPIPLFTGDAREVMDPLWDVPGQICIQVDDPVPATILAVIPEIMMGDGAK